MKNLVFRIVSLGVSGTVLTLLTGCGSTPEAPTSLQRQQSAEIQIQSIQNNPDMPAAAKQRAIDGMKAQQNRTVIQPVSGPSQQLVETQIQSIQNNPNMPAEAKQRAIEGLKFQQSRTTTRP